MGKFVHERTMFKVLIERTGILFSVTLKQRAYFFFISKQLFGARIAPTTDPNPGIVEFCNYEIPVIVDKWNQLANIKLKTKQK
jgi:hypothetical protein